MDDFLSVLLVAVFYLVVALSGNKKKKAKNEKKRAARTRDVSFDQAFTDNSGQTPRGRILQSQPPLASDGHAAQCETSRIHLHDIPAQQMDAAAEGEDPCHVGSAPDMQDTPAFSYDEETAQQNEMAQDVLRGVIMSEILSRPYERAAIKRNGRSIR